jgi:glycine hydroxymethyltransferase
MTTRGLKEGDFTKVVDFIDESINLTAEIASKVPGNFISYSGKKFKDFTDALAKDDASKTALESIKKRVIDFSLNFPAVGQ